MAVIQDLRCIATTPCCLPGLDTAEPAHSSGMTQPHTANPQPTHSQELAWPEGLEPPTHVLEGHCSIQMSYGQIGCNPHYSPIKKAQRDGPKHENNCG